MIEHVYCEIGDSMYPPFLCLNLHNFILFFILRKNNIYVRDSLTIHEK